MSPEQRRRLFRLILLLVVAVILLIAGRRIAGPKIGVAEVIVLVVLGALIGFWVNRKR